MVTDAKTTEAMITMNVLPTGRPNHLLRKTGAPNTTIPPAKANTSAAWPVIEKRRTYVALIGTPSKLIRLTSLVCSTWSGLVPGGIPYDAILRSCSFILYGFMPAPRSGRAHQVADDF